MDAICYVLSLPPLPRLDACPLFLSARPHRCFLFLPSCQRCFFFFYSRLVLFFYFFFFNEPAPPQILPFSPTRRSPDLAGAGEVAQRHQDGGRAHRRAHHPGGARARGLAGGGATGHAQDGGIAPPQPAGQAGGLRRSEEHTSELQSHVNLVCRLLLEKKK